MFKKTVKFYQFNQIQCGKFTGFFKMFCKDISQNRTCLRTHLYQCNRLWVSFKYDALGSKISHQTKKPTKIPTVLQIPLPTPATFLNFSLLSFYVSNEKQTAKL